MSKIFDQVFWRFIQHRGHWPRFFILVDDLINTSSRSELVVALGLDDTTEVAAFANPVPLLDDPPIHVYDVQCAIRTRSRVNRSEQRIGRGEEFGFDVWVL